MNINTENVTDEYYLKLIEKGDVDAIFRLAKLYDKQEKYELAEKYYLMAIEKVVAVQ